MRTVMREVISTAPAARLPLILFVGDRERISRDLSDRRARLDARVEELLAELERGIEEPWFWLFVSSSTGYSLVEQRGREPKRGDIVDLEGAEYRVAVVADWSFLDGRRCAYLEPAAIAIHRSEEPRAPRLPSSRPTA